MVEAANSTIERCARKGLRQVGLLHPISPWLATYLREQGYTVVEVNGPLNQYQLEVSW